MSAILNKVATVYTTAFLDSVESSVFTVEEVIRDLYYVRRVLDTYPVFLTYLNSPLRRTLLSSELRKMRTLQELLEGRVCDITLRFLWSLVAHNRIEILPICIDRIRWLSLERLSRCEIHISSASLLTSGETMNIVENVRRRLEALDADILMRVNPRRRIIERVTVSEARELISGFVVQVVPGVLRIDSSLIGNLGKLVERVRRVESSF
jgi:F0F1-type ATP synthase delta subunit